LKTVIDELLADKKAIGRSPRYFVSLRSILGRFATGRESLPMASLALLDVERWLDGKKAAGRATFKVRLSTLFAFAVRRRYRPDDDNPCDALEARRPSGQCPLRSSRCAQIRNGEKRPRTGFLIDDDP